MKIAGIILAAGSSTRMTKYKQLLTFRGKTLMSHIFSKAVQLQLAEIYCITGFLDSALKEPEYESKIKFLHNSSHKNGMTSSLQLGLSRLDNDIDAVIVMLSDQPLIEVDHYQKLLELSHKNPENIIVSSYSNTFGVPVIIPRWIFDEIIAANHTSPAKKILKQYSDNIIELPCPLAAIDIDTDEDYQNLISEHE